MVWGDDMSNLVLHLTYNNFDQIKEGRKKEEYRLVEKWRKHVEIVTGKRVDAGQRCKRRRHMLVQLIPKKIQPVVEKKNST